MTSFNRSSARSTAVTQQTCSWLLTYPDDDVIRRLPQLKEALTELPSAASDPLGRFFTYAETVSVEELRIHYVATFDMRRRCCPFLTYWTHGDTRNRGQAILRFKQTYRDAGVVPSDDELPDHLSVVLEFAALADSQAGNLMLGEHRVAIELLRDALHNVESPYGYVLDAVVSTLIPMTDELAERARQLAASGPPTELVGVGGPVDIAITPYSVAQTTGLTEERR